MHHNACSMAMPNAVIGIIVWDNKDNSRFHPFNNKTN